jgi:nucleoside-diphosphate-sugar epimerase
VSTSYTYRHCDLRDATGLDSILAEFNPCRVLHLAGAVSGSDSAALQAHNVDATRSLFESMLRLKLDVPVIFASSGSVYGEPVYLPQDERHPTVPVLDYAKSKLEAETVAAALAQGGGIPLTIARIFNVVGPGSPTSLLPGSLALQLAVIARKNQPSTIRVGPLEAVRDYIDVRDCARAISILADGAPPSIVNVASGVGTPVKEIFESLREIARSYGVSSFETESAGVLPKHASIHVGSNDRLSDVGFSCLIPLHRSLADLFRWAFDVCSRP